MLERATAMTKLGGFEDKVLPKRQGPRGLIPSTWLNRILTLDYTSADGKASSTSGVFLDWSPTGPILDVKGTKTIISWDFIHVIELQED